VSAEDVADAFDDDSRSIATRFASYAAVAASKVYAHQNTREMARNLQVALVFRVE
jgi:hypothetical protein